MNCLVGLVVFAVAVGPVQLVPIDDSLAGLLHRDDVQAELKLTASQKKKWAEYDRMPSARRGSTFEGDPLLILDPEVVERRDVLREKKVWSFLGPDQSVRMMELLVQREGVKIILRPSHQVILSLSDEQRDTVRQAKARHNGAIRELIGKVSAAKGEIGRVDPKKVRDAQKKIEAELMEELDKIPTQDQRNLIATLEGKKFRFLERKF